MEPAPVLFYADVEHTTMKLLSNFSWKTWKQVILKIKLKIKN